MAVRAIAAGGLAAYQVWSGFQQASLIRQQGELNNQIAELNAEYTERDAAEAARYGFTQAARYQSVIDRTVGEQRVGFASQGVDVSSGTAKEIQEETRHTGFLNQLDMINQARQRAYGLKVQASNIRLGANMSEIQTNINASAAQMSGIAQGIQTGLSGYSRYQNASTNS